MQFLPTLSFSFSSLSRFLLRCFTFFHHPKPNSLSLKTRKIIIIGKTISSNNSKIDWHWSFFCGVSIWANKFCLSPRNFWKLLWTLLNLIFCCVTIEFDNVNFVVLKNVTSYFWQTVQISSSAFFSSCPILYLQKSVSDYFFLLLFFFVVEISI